MVSAGSLVHAASWARSTLIGGLGKNVWVCGTALLDRWVISAAWLAPLISLLLFPDWSIATGVVLVSERETG